MKGVIPDLDWIAWQGKRVVTAYDEHVETDLIRRIFAVTMGRIPLWIVAKPVQNKLLVRCYPGGYSVNMRQPHDLAPGTIVNLPRVAHPVSHREFEVVLKCGNRVRLSRIHRGPAKSRL